MIWSLAKILAFVAIIAALALGAGWLMEAEGGVQITAGGTEYTLGPLQSVIALSALVLAVWLAFKLLSLLIAVWHFLNGDETAISRYFDRSRERKGFQALAEGLIALASGEGREAMRKANRAARYLQKPELTDLVTAQAAEMVGDRKTADTVYKKLLKNPDTRFVGVRGILKQKLSEGQTEVALKLAETAFALKPRHEETQDILLKLQAGSADWAGARETLNAKLRHGSLPRDVHRRRDAVLALSEAKGVFEDGRAIEARETAVEANRLSPDLVPAAVMAARAYIAKNQGRYAARVIKKAWESQPHPDLAAAFADIVAHETPAERVKRFRALTTINATHPETKMLRAELNIAAEDFPEARRAMGDLATEGPTTRSLTIIAAIERGEGASDAVVKGWLTKALSAPRGPQWVCDNCHATHGEWAPVCSSCESFDTLSWTIPPSGQVMTATGAEMLPLIVGSIEDKSHAPGAVDTPVAEVVTGEVANENDVPADAEVVDVTPPSAETEK